MNPFPTLDHVMTQRRLPLPLLCLLAACGPESAGSVGEETSPCNDGLCLQGLECRSDLCVDPDWQPGTSGVDSGSDDNGETDADDTSVDPTPTVPSDEVDILFVIDNSGSMSAPQRNLSENVDRLIVPLVDAGLDLRVAVTTTDDSNYWCTGNNVSAAESGQFVLSSCLGRLNDFYFSGTDENAESVCTDYCTLNDAELEIQPTTTESDPSPRPHPWVEIGSQGTNLPAGVNPAAALQCFLPQGINGCGFESTLESQRKALRLASLSDQTEFGFIRDGAHLAIVFVTDEADCSFNRDHQRIVFGEEGVGNQVFWSLPDVQQSPSSAVCWNAGVDCSFSLSSDQCVSANKDVDGNPTDDFDAAALYPLALYRSELEEIREQKLPSGADVFVFGIVGIAGNYEQVGEINYVEGPNAGDAFSFQAQFGIGQGCTSQVTEAVPPVRIRELVEDSAWGDNGGLYSVCDSTYAPALGNIASTIVNYAL